MKLMQMVLKLILKGMERGINEQREAININYISMCSNVRLRMVQGTQTKKT
jgi:hypothetical protein